MTGVRFQGRTHAAAIWEATIAAISVAIPATRRTGMVTHRERTMRVKNARRSGDPTRSGIGEICEKFEKLSPTEANNGTVRYGPGDGQVVSGPVWDMVRQILREPKYGHHR